MYYSTFIGVIVYKLLEKQTFETPNFIWKSKNTNIQIKTKTCILSSLN